MDGEQNKNVDSKQGSKPVGGIIAVIIIVLIIILAGFYLLGDKTTGNRDAVLPGATGEEIMGTSDASLDALLETSASDDTSAIEADINSTELSMLDAELSAMEAEINAEMPQ